MTESRKPCHQCDNPNAKGIHTCEPVTDQRKSTEEIAAECTGLKRSDDGRIVSFNGIGDILVNFKLALDAERFIAHGNENIIINLESDVAELRAEVEKLLKVVNASDDKTLIVALENQVKAAVAEIEQIETVLEKKIATLEAEHHEIKGIHYTQIMEYQAHAAVLIDVLRSLRVDLQGAHDTECNPTWTAYGRHAPNALCDLIVEIDEALTSPLSQSLLRRGEAVENLIVVARRVEDLLDLVVVDPSKALKTHAGVECQRQLREALKHLEGDGR